MRRSRELNEIDKAIEDTIDYARVYNCTLSIKELTRRLITKREFSDKEIKKAAIKFKKRLGKDDQSESYERKLSKAQKYGRLFSIFFPSILFIGVTGSVASRYPREEDDIDFLIITSKDSLWITRLLMRILVFAAGIPHRRYKQKEKKDELCFNLWLDEDALTIPVSKQNLKSAVDGRLMIPVVDKNNTYEKFMLENKWIEKYLADKKKKEKVRKGKKVNMFLRPVAWINFLVYWPQYWVMRPKMRRETVNRKQAFFHPEDEKDRGVFK